MDLPRRKGRALYLPDFAVFIFDPTVTRTNGHGEARISVLNLSGSIRGIEFDETSFGELPVARVDYAVDPRKRYHRGYIQGALMNAQDRSLKGSVYVDYSAAAAYKTPADAEAGTPNVPVIMAIPGSAKFRAFSISDGKNSLVHFFWNQSYWSGLANVGTFVYSTTEGWSIKERPEFGMRIDLDTITPATSAERYQIYKMTGAQKLNAGEHENYEILMPGLKATSEQPVILKNPRLLFENKKTHERFFQADHRADRDREFSSTLGWRNVYMNEFGHLRGFLSSYPIAQISERYPFEPERLTPGVSIDHELLFAKIESAEPSGYVIFGKNNGHML